jgi:predicted DNA-binding protein YlxM (UPF0122 family)
MTDNDYVWKDCTEKCEEFRLYIYSFFHKDRDLRKAMNAEDFYHELLLMLYYNNKRGLEYSIKANLFIVKRNFLRKIEFGETELNEEVHYDPRHDLQYTEHPRIEELCKLLSSILPAKQFFVLDSLLGLSGLRLSGPEIAVLLNITKSCVYQYKKKAILRLQKILTYYDIKSADLNQIIAIFDKYLNDFKSNYQFAGLNSKSSLPNRVTN